MTTPVTTTEPTTIDNNAAVSSVEASKLDSDKKEEEQLSTESPEEYEQHCILFPTYSYKEVDNGSDEWNIRVRGWAFNSPKKSRTRELFMDIASWATGLKEGDESYEILHARTELFWASNISKGEYTIQAVGVTDAKKMTIEGDPNEPTSQETHAAKVEEPKVQQILENAQKIHLHGHPAWEAKSIKIKPKEGTFTGTLAIKNDIISKWDEQATKNQQAGILQSIWNFMAPPSTSSSSNHARLLKLQAYHSQIAYPAFGVVNLIEPEGYSVISDIDDTIKDTDISAGAKVVLSNTFLHKFKEVPGMAALYKFWYNKGAGIHYVSNSPWQLFPMLRGFFEVYDFPTGSAHLKFYDGLIKSAYQQKENPMASKFMYIRELLKDFPKRQFILVGDTGELDPEIYTTIARENPGRILRIFIRDVTTARVKDLPAQEPHRSYIQTFPSIIGHLKTYYSAEDKDKQNKQQEQADLTPTKTEVPEPTPADPHKPERHGSLSTTFLDKLHTDISHLHIGSTSDSEAAAKPPAAAAIGTSSKPAQGQQALKTPLQMFHERIENITKDLPKDLFILFTNPITLQNDEAIRKAFNY
ncbi:8733_t:CDS:2 [Ambispora gerdemannii]|uniref:8733_t:CDS:1 n=1 Tax=Ambispora gerdemannii TaxID=144530 RepID=A0A9N9G6U8_9GLOM|nr:8733_t:CDS:2 [Ambispora gerdemannii]